MLLIIGWSAYNCTGLCGNHKNGTYHYNRKSTIVFFRWFEKEGEWGFFLVFIENGGDNRVRDMEIEPKQRL
ncbi:MAG: hypothetical protein ACYTDW_12730, partial [Planctomycetota bacterium]